MLNIRRRRIPAEPGCRMRAKDDVAGYADNTLLWHNHDSTPPNRTLTAYSPRTGRTRKRIVALSHSSRWVYPAVVIEQAALARDLPYLSGGGGTAVRKKLLSRAVGWRPRWPTDRMTGTHPRMGHRGIARRPVPGRTRPCLDSPARLWAVCSLDVQALPRQSLGIRVAHRRPRTVAKRRDER